MYKKLFLTGFLSLGILFFCLGQSPKQDFIRELKESGKKTRKRTNEFLETLNVLQEKYKDHLSEDCSDQIELERNFGAYYYLNYVDSLTFKYWLNAAEKLIPSCDNLSDSVKTQVYLNLEGGFERLKTADGDRSREEYISKIKDVFNRRNTLSQKFQAKAFERVADFYFDNNDIDNGILWIRKALSIYNKIPVARKTLLAYRRYADFMLSIDNYSAAEEWYLKLLKEAKELYSNDKSNKFIFHALYGLSGTHLETKEYEKAKPYVDEILKVGESEQDSLWLVDAHFLRGKLANVAGEFEKSSTNLTKAISILETNKSKLSKESLITFYLLEIENNQHLKRLELAKLNLLKCYELCLANKFENKVIVDISDQIIIDKKIFASVALYASKLAQKIDWQSDDIISFTNNIDSLIYQSLSDLTGDNSKIQLLELHHLNNEQILKYIFENGLTKKYEDLTAYFISSSKSIALYESISKRNQIPADIKELYSDLKNKEVQLISGISKAVELNKQNKVDSLSNVYFELSYELEDLYKSLQGYNIEVDFSSNKKEFLSKAKNNLENNSALVDLFYGEDYIYGYSIHNDIVKFHYDSIPKELDAEFLESLFKDDVSSIQIMNTGIDALSDYFRPFFPNDFENIDDLTIISDGQLLYLPFEILEFNEKDLIEEVNINYAFSNSLNQYDYANNGSYEFDYLGLGMNYGDQLLQNIEQSDNITRSYNGSVRLSPLPFAVEEIKSGYEIFGGSILLNKECTIENFTQSAEKSKIIHIANHSLLNDKNSNLSSIVFGSSEFPELYNVIDIKALELNADLAILSSCNSGRGELFDGNGIRSLGQSFAQAGCPAVMVNLWEANDKSSRFIIDQFNNYIKEGLKKSNALRQAKLDYLDQASPSLKHPKYWANIVLIGNNDAIQFNNGIHWIYFLIGGLLLVILGGYYIRKRMK